MRNSLRVEVSQEREEEDAKSSGDHSGVTGFGNLICKLSRLLLFYSPFFTSKSTFHLFSSVAPKLIHSQDPIHQPLSHFSGYSLISLAAPCLPPSPFSLLPSPSVMSYCSLAIVCASFPPPPSPSPSASPH